VACPSCGLADAPTDPDIEAGNMVYKNPAFMTAPRPPISSVEAAVPSILPSRADTSTIGDSQPRPCCYAGAVARDPQILHRETAE
jgi:phosphate acetyltransferase